MIKVLHVADTHLGYSAYRKTTSEGINQRESDIYNSFKQVIDYAIDNQVDLILHAGDLFDAVRPTNRAITMALYQLLRLSENKIPMIIIAGNHEQPKLQETGHIFNLFEHISYIYPIYHEKYETKNFTLNDETLLIHCLPQINTQNTFQTQLESIKHHENKDYNIFLSHGSVQGIKEFSMNEFNEMLLPKNYLSSMFDYVALGHFHTHTKINNTAYYSGSTDTFSFSETSKEHGFLEIILENQRKIVTFKQINTRPFIDTPIIDCYAKDIDKIMKEIIKTIQTIDPVDKIFRINLHHILSHQYRGLDFRVIRQQCQGCFHYEINVNIEEEDRKRFESYGKIDSLTKEFTRFINDQGFEKKDLLLKIGLEYLTKSVKKDDL
jgi:DNA repair exonuclease SbcCD nuclease subunit